MRKSLKSYKEVEQLTGLTRERLQFLIESGRIRMSRPNRNRVTFDLQDLVTDLAALDQTSVTSDNYFPSRGSLDASALQFGIDPRGPTLGAGMDLAERDPLSDQQYVAAS